MAVIGVDAIRPTDAALVIDPGGGCAAATSRHSASTACP
jgi:hypothetical protein